MSEPNQTSGLHSDGNADWTEKQLPPVKPPTAGLLMQLFFIPMIIVSIIVAVWLTFGWLAQSGTNPEQLVSNLRRLNKGSWQDAHGLSNMLRDPRGKDLRQNKKLAASLSETLRSLLEENLDVDKERQKLALWLCRALGEFEVDTGLNTLLKAIEYDDFEVRCASAEGISRLANNLGTDIKKAHHELVEKLESPAMERSDSPDRKKEIAYGELRSTVAYALGIIGGDEACNILSMMLSDPYPEARYNAATGLARNGDVRSIPRLREMLALNNQEAIRYEGDNGTLKAWKQNLVIVNGLRGVRELYTVNTAIEVNEELGAAINALDASGTLGSQDAGRYVMDEVIRLLDERKAKGS